VTAIKQLLENNTHNYRSQMKLITSRFKTWLAYGSNRTLLGILTLSVLASLCGCETTEHQRWKSRKKEREDPQPTRYETPFSQIRTEPSAPLMTQNNELTGQELPPQSKAEPEIVEPPTYIPGSNAIPSGVAIKDKPGFVLSPYAPDKGLVDVRGFPPGTDVRDPFSGRPMKVPAPLNDPKKSQQGQGDTLNPETRPSVN
jgi:hypothetical protein